MRTGISIALLALIVLCIGFIPSLPPQTLAQSKTRYNVLLITADDLRPVIGAYGDKIVRTPNIDKLAGRGIRFDRAYCQYPLCNPTRSSFLTGKYPTQTGVLDNEYYFRALHPELVSLPQHFQANGYVTLRSGKTFHGGIDDAEYWTEGGEPRNFKGAKRPPSNPDSADRTAASDRIVVLEGNGEKDGDYRSASRAIDMLEKYKDQQFFMAFGASKPHSPPAAPQKFFDLYDVDKMPLPPDFASTPAAPPGFPEISIARRNTDLFIGREASAAQAREMVRAYYASVSYMDEQVGRVLDALDRLGLRDKTIVVFLGDHGYHLGEKGKWSKAYSLFDIATRVPFIVATPQTKGAASPRTVQLLDIFPTLVELCGLKDPYAPGSKLEGHSLVPLLRKPNSTWNYPALSVVQYQQKIGRAVTTERWHYVSWEDGKAGEMLTDLKNDPHELKNLASDPKYAATKKQMQELLKLIP
jgi:arylsulfatase A-like enzyme